MMLENFQASKGNFRISRILEVTLGGMSVSSGDDWDTTSCFGFMWGKMK